jgi:hypothetical protein
MFCLCVVSLDLARTKRVSIGRVVQDDLASATPCTQKIPPTGHPFHRSKPLVKPLPDVQEGTPKQSDGAQLASRRVAHWVRSCVAPPSHWQDPGPPGRRAASPQNEAREKTMTLALTNEAMASVGPTLSRPRCPSSSGQGSMLPEMNNQAGFSTARRRVSRENGPGWRCCLWGGAYLALGPAAPRAGCVGSGWADGSLLAKLVAPRQ